MRQRQKYRKNTEADVEAMLRRYHVDGATQLDIAAEFGANVTQVHRIVHGKAWPHVYERFAAEFERGR